MEEQDQKREARGRRDRRCESKRRRRFWIKEGRKRVRIKRRINRTKG